MQPYIGLTCSADDEGGPVVRPWYVRAIHDAGGLAVVLPFVADRDGSAPDRAQAWLARLDGIVFTGSEDLHPVLWGEEPHPALCLMHPHRQATEVALARAVLERDTPMLAICGGMQTLSQVAGGTLVAHIPDLTGSYLNHQDPTLQRLHAVTAEPDTIVARCMGTSFRTNTEHHQAVERPGEGMVVTARCEDGIVEAWEMPDRPYAVGVQWHPERMEDHRPLFERLVAAARATSGDR